MDAANITGTVDGLIVTNLANESSTDDMNPGWTDGSLISGAPSQHPSPDMFTILVHTLLFIVGGLGNIGTILAFALDPKLREKPSDFIILALAVADSYICLVETTLVIITEVMKTWIFGEIGCRMRYAMLTCCINAGINLIVALSWDRYLLLAKEYGDYMKLQTRKMIIGHIIIAWLCAAILLL
ncbi:5-hydroxytryptamine receptor 1-like [Amphiura filiformis]|uniref:5-hydroxytryptamine receptor 1-like n=1 Tax=Amphiura filiformis TaxID=82378 RepID=UPI003B219BBB